MSERIDHNNIGKLDINDTFSKIISKNRNRYFKKSALFCEKEITLESGAIACQADASVLISCKGTMILTTVVFDKEAPKHPVNFLPLSVTYREMMSSAGKFPGGFMKRESKPTDAEVLISRIIDRSVRPLFPKEFTQEVQLISTVLSYDKEADPSVLAVIGACAALATSGIPIKKVIAAVRIGLEDDKVVLFPSVSSNALKNLDIFVSGCAESVTMVEGFGKEFQENQFLDIVMEALSTFTPLIDLISEMRSIVSEQVFEVCNAKDAALVDVEDAVCNSGLIKSFKNAVFKDCDVRMRKEYVKELKKSIKVAFEDKEVEESQIDEVLEKHIINLIRQQVLEANKRIDGRKAEHIRSISSKVGFLPKAHGSAIFTRGQTQALATVTLGSEDDAQINTDLTGFRKDSFLLHYNFHPYSAGEIGPIKAPTRREINHGYLALRSLASVMSDVSNFPYTVRVTSEILESCGSTSMATVCAGTMALMDAGVPIKKMVAGIAMGLIYQQDKYAVLSDISVEEDNAGHMDFKVAGTKDGITAVQMDIKVEGISQAILKDALEQAKQGRLHILSEMQKTISCARDKISASAPVYDVIDIAQEDIKRLIGSGGKVIKGICDSTEAKINIDDNGKVSIFSPNQKMLKITIKKINSAIGVDENKVGDKFSAKIVKIIDSGIFVSWGDAKEGYVHISEIFNERIDNINNHLSVGQELKVVVISVDFGKLRLSVKKYDADLSEIKSQKSFFNKRFSRDSKRRGSNDHSGKYFNKDKRYNNNQYNKVSNLGNKKTNSQTNERKYF